MRQGDSDRDIDRSKIMGCKKLAAVREIKSKHAAITSGFRLLGVRAYVSTIRKRTRAHYFPRHIGGPHTADL
jgi:hypothetical protein